MTVAIASVSPRRARGTASFTITGTGFGPNPGDNDVIVSGSSGTITAESAVSVTFTLPFLFQIGIIRDVHVRCQLVNLTNNESAWFWIRIKANVNEVADATLIRAVPGPFELLGAGSDRQRFMEAKDAERLVTMIEALLRDSTEGQVLAGTGTGIAEPGGAPREGGYLLTDVAEATGLRWAKADLARTLPFGGAAPAAATLLVAGGDNAAVPGTDTEHGVGEAGTADLIWLLVKSGGPTLDRVRLLVNGSSVFDSGAGLGLGNNALFSAAPAAAITAGQRVELEATSLGGTTNLVGGVRFTPS